MVFVTAPETTSDLLYEFKKSGSTLLLSSSTNLSLTNSSLSNSGSVNFLTIPLDTFAEVSSLSI